MLGCVLLLGCTAWVRAARLPVLDQIDVPHPYYFREMYLPQLTSGPSGLTWSPDSSGLIYSMAGVVVAADHHERNGATTHRP